MSWRRCTILQTDHPGSGSPKRNGKKSWRYLTLHCYCIRPPRSSENILPSRKMGFLRTGQPPGKVSTGWHYSRNSRKSIRSEDWHGIDIQWGRFRLWCIITCKSIQKCLNLGYHVTNGHYNAQQTAWIIVSELIDLICPDSGGRYLSFIIFLPKDTLSKWIKKLDIMY